MVILELVKPNDKEKEEATKEFIRLLELANAYLKEAQEIQRKYNIEIPQ